MAYINEYLIDFLQIFLQKLDRSITNTAGPRFSLAYYKLQNVNTDIIYYQNNTALPAAVEHCLSNPLAINIRILDANFNKEVMTIQVSKL